MIFEWDLYVSLRQMGVLAGNGKDLLKIARNKAAGLASARFGLFNQKVFIPRIVGFSCV